VEYFHPVLVEELVETSVLEVDISIGSDVGNLVVDVEVVDVEMGVVLVVIGVVLVLIGVVLVDT